MLDRYVELEDDPERPRTGTYLDLNYVPWYARMTFKERIEYLDWIIAIRQTEHEAWLDEHYPKKDDGGFSLRAFVRGPTAVEDADRIPCPVVMVRLRKMLARGGAGACRRRPDRGRVQAW